MLREEDIPRSSYACHRVVEVGRHPCFARRTPCASRGGHSVIILRVSLRGRGGQTPVLREEDTPCFARRTFRDHLTLVTFSVEGHLAKVNAW